MHVSIGKQFPPAHPQFGDAFIRSKHVSSPKLCIWLYALYFAVAILLHTFPKPLLSLQNMQIRLSRFEELGWGHPIHKQTASSHFSFGNVCAFPLSLCLLFSFHGCSFLCESFFNISWISKCIVIVAPNVCVSYLRLWMFGSLPKLENLAWLAPVFLPFACSHALQGHFKRLSASTICFSLAVAFTIQ